jgi:IclR family transcriptional regulator, KDG regulon repressor
MDKTLVKGLQVLTHIAHAEKNVRITDVAQDLNLTKSNAYRVLKTLESAGFIKQDPRTKDFLPSIKIWELGTQVINRLDIRSHATEALHRLADESRETVHLAILDGKEVVYIDKIDSPEPVSAYTRLGGRAPAYCVATGKAMLSQLSEAEQSRLLVDLEKHSPFTITDPIKLREELAKAKANGYAINRGEWRESVWGLAVPIKDGSGGVAAAVGVSGPRYRYRLDNEQRCEELALLVKKTAREILQSLRNET